MMIAGVAATMPLWCSGALAQWSSDPGVNLAVATGGDEQVLCKAVGGPGGETYISWFQLEGTGGGANYNLWIQVLDRAGVSMLPGGGPIRVGNRTQGTSLVDYDMIALRGGGVAIAASDTQNGSDLDVAVYKVTREGQVEWTREASNNAWYEPDPRLVELSDGGIAVVWPRLSSGAYGLHMQIYTPGGTARLTADGVRLATGATTEGPAFQEVVASDAGSVIVSWARDTRQFNSPRHVMARKFDATGAAVWGAGPITVSSFPVPIAHRPRLVSDGEGGAVLAWHDFRAGDRSQVFVQRINAAGAIRWGANGLAVSTSTTTSRFDPAIAFEPEAGDVFVAALERSISQNQRGLMAQKVASDGTLAWTGTGVTLLPLDATDELFPRVRSVAGGGAMVFCLDAPGSPLPGNRVIGFRLDGSGNQVWSERPLVVSSNQSVKGRLPIATMPDGTVVLAWEDGRSGGTDIYAQAVNPAGVLGRPACPADVNGDGFLDFFDYSAFVACFEGQGCEPGTNADYNLDGFADFFDFADFSSDFEGGC